MEYFLQGTEPLNGVAIPGCNFTCSGTFNHCANEQCVGEGALGCTFSPPCPGNMMCGTLQGNR
jgi:hypothetical protein